MSRIIDETLQNSVVQGDYMLVDNLTTGTHRIEAKNLMDTKAEKVDGIAGTTINRYGTCSTQADTAAKEVTVTGTITLEAGAKITVKFDYDNTASSPTLSVNSGDAKNIYQNGIQITTGDNKSMLKGIVDFIYDGTQWNLMGGNSPASAAPLMDGTAAVGTSVSYAREDHVHPTDTTRIPTSAIGAANGVAELDANGIVVTSQLPSYVDDVLEYSSVSAFPATGESGKIYVATDTNLTYRWAGSDYVVITSSLALGETSATAYRGDRGKTAYDHATDADKLATAQTSGLYKIATTAEGHVASVTAVQKSDITDLGIPASDTTYESKVAASGGTDVSLVTTGEKYEWNNKLSTHQTIKQDGITGATTNRYATCSTAAATAAKTASVTSGTFALEAGARVTVNFANANTANTPTLNIGSTGDIAIYYKGAQITTGSEKELVANVSDFVYDGTYWNLIASSSVIDDVTRAEIDEIITNVTPSESGYVTQAEIDEIVGNVGSVSLILLLNQIYPVGCYFETSDANFNPNNSFMGTWVLDPDYGSMAIDDSASSGTVDGDLSASITTAGITDIAATNAVYRWHRTA